MTHKRRFKVDKLIRDKLPQIMRSKEIGVSTRTMDEKEYIERLKDKLLEESKEVSLAKSKEEICEELADVLEVIMSLGNVYNLSFEIIEEFRMKKKVDKGGFEGKIYSDFIEITNSNKNIDYYLSRPDLYPEIQ